MPILMTRASKYMGVDADSGYVVGFDEVDDIANGVQPS